MTELERLEKRIRERFVKAFATYHLLEDGDHVLAALSGGKDSLCMLEMLARRSKIQHPQFCLEAIHVHMENITYETSTDYLERFCKELEVPLHIVTASFDKLTDKRHNPCFLCSWNRRKQMFNLAQARGCNKIALGHHMDDILHTALMNQLFQGRFGTMPALLAMRKMPLKLIRPLCMVEEKDIRRYAELRGYERQVKLCPYENDTRRTDIRRFFEEIECMNPEARYSLWNALNSEGKLVEE